MCELTLFTLYTAQVSMAIRNKPVKDWQSWAVNGEKERNEYRH